MSELHPAGTNRKGISVVPKACPRCISHDWIPNNNKPGAYPGAISRADNATEICSACGEDEALKDFFDGGCEAVDAWPVVRTYSTI
jgi:hypothetical protein